MKSDCTCGGQGVFRSTDVGRHMCVCRGESGRGGGGVPGGEGMRPGCACGGQGREGDGGGVRVPGSEAIESDYTCTGKRGTVKNGVGCLGVRA